MAPTAHGGSPSSSPSSSSPPSSTPPATATTATSAAAAGGPERKRVKVYELKNNDWFDRGTGFCTGQLYNSPNSSPENPDARIVVLSEDEPTRTLLETRISKDDGYQKQQDTLIVWTEQNGVDMALSFQEAEACASIWEFVNEIQVRLSQLSGPDDALSDDVPEHMQSIPLVEPELGHLENLEMVIRAASTSAASRDALAKSVMHPEQNYILKLAPLVTKAEEIESTPDLHRLCTIMKHLILLNDTAIIEFIVTDQAIMGVVGALEYDPDFPSHRANHRQWLSDTSKFKEVVPIQDPEIRKKIHWTYRLLYLKDVVLARILDDPTFSVLNSLIFFHQVDIVNHLQSNQQFLKDLFDIFKAPDAEMAEKKKEAVLFIQNCCAVSKNIQAQSRAQLYQNFIGHGLFGVVTFALKHPDAAVRVAGTDILVALIDHDPHMVRGHIFTALREKTVPLTDTLIELLLVEVDLGVKSQMADAIKILLDPTTNQMGMDMINRGQAAANAEFKGRQNHMGQDPNSRINGQHPQTNAFIDSFYESSAKRLFAPLKELEHRESMANLSVQEISLYIHLVEVLCFFVRQHSFKSKLFILSENLHSRVAQLLACPQKYMKLTALKWFRTCVALQDEFHNRQIIQNELFAPILQIVEETMPRDNLLNSACLEFFEYIKRESVKQLIVHLVDLYRDRLERITYVNTFGQLVDRYDLFMAGHPGANGNDDSFTTQPGTPPRMVNGRQSFAGLKDMDGEEEAYFNNEDDIEDDDAGLPTMKQRVLINGASPVRPLVSYPEDEDEEEAEGMDILASSPDPPVREKKSSSSGGSDDNRVWTDLAEGPPAREHANEEHDGHGDDHNDDENMSTDPKEDTPRRRGRNRTRSPPRQPAQNSPPEPLAVKRRREEEDDDELGKMMGGIKRRTSSASIRSNASHHSQLDASTDGSEENEEPSGPAAHTQSAAKHSLPSSTAILNQSHGHGHGSTHILRRKGSLRVKNESSGGTQKFALKPVGGGAAAKHQTRIGAPLTRMSSSNRDAEAAAEEDDPGGDDGGGSG